MHENLAYSIARFSIESVVQLRVALGRCRLGSNSLKCSSILCRLISYGALKRLQFIVFERIDWLVRVVQRAHCAVLFNLVFVFLDKAGQRLIEEVHHSASIVPISRFI